MADGFEVTLSRTEFSSPAFLENHSPVDDLIQLHCFNSKEEQAKWVADAIKSNLHDDELRPDDIESTSIVTSSPKGLPWVKVRKNSRARGKNSATVP